MSTPDTPSTPILRAMGIGGFVGSCIAAGVLGNPWWVLIGVAIFVGTAILSATIDAVIAEIRNQKEKSK